MPRWCKSEISKPLVTQLLSESILLEAEGKNTHLEHLEDNILNNILSVIVFLVFAT